MGSASRVKPERLAEKLLLIRSNFDCSQTEMAEKLSSDRVKVRRSDVSRYELGLREPPLTVLLQYARLAKVIVDVLIDDDVNLA